MYRNQHLWTVLIVLAIVRAIVGIVASFRKPA